MGLRENHKNVVRLQAAAEVVERGGLPDLTASELMVLAFLFHRFKHHAAAATCASLVDRRRRGDPAFAAESDAYDKAVEGVSEADFKTIKRPEAQSALSKVDR